MMAWRLREARARFGRLVRKAIADGPQTVFRYGKPVAVVMSIDEYRRLQARRPSLKETLMSGPDGELELPERTVQERVIDR